MTLVHACVSIFDVYKVDNGVLPMILLFIFIYQFSSGPIAWIYAVETTIDVALGLVLLTLFSTIFVLSLVCPILMGKDSIGPNNVFIMFSAFSFLGAVYAFFVMKETKGLTDKEKKELLMPNKYKE